MTKAIWTIYWQKHSQVTRYGGWAQKRAMHEAFEIIKEEKIDKGTKVIDIGCGEGRTLLAFRKNDFKKSLGLDNTQESLILCQKKGFIINQDVFLGEAEKTGFKSQAFALVFSEGLLEHYRQPRPIIKEMARISSKYILLIQPNHNSLVGKVIAFLGPLLRGKVREYPFSENYFVSQFKSNGLILKVKKYTPLKEFFILLFEKIKSA